MQLGLPFTREPVEPTEPTEPTEPYFVRHRRARRYVLRVDPDGRVRITIPRGGSRREAEAFAQRHARWIARQRAKLPHDVPSIDEWRALRDRARRELPPRLLALA